MDQELINRIVKEVKDSLLRDQVRPAAPDLGGDLLRKVFVTADDLAGRISGGTSSSVELAANEYLTPAARDLAERRKIGITRKPDPLAVKVARPVLPQKAVPTCLDVPLSASRNTRGTGPVGLITYLADAKTDQVLKALAHDGIFFTDCMESDCWMVNLAGLCRAVTSGEVSLGVALFPFGADAVIMANKIPGIRAVQGTVIESVAASVRRLDTNLLVLEHRLSTFHELRAMTRFFVRNRMVAGLAGDVIARIRELEKYTDRNG